MDLLKFEKLDIEFALDFDDKVHIFQVRPILVDHRILILIQNFKNEINLHLETFIYYPKSNTMLEIRQFIQICQIGIQLR